MLQGQGIAPLLELVQCTLLGNALHRAHKLPSLLYTECLQSHQMLFFCFILLVSCEASLSRQMNHIVIGCNEFNYAISFFIMKQSHILQTGKVLFGPTALSWSLARKAQLRTNRSSFFFPLCFYLSFTVCIYPRRDHNYTCVLKRGNFMFTARGCCWRVNHLQHIILSGHGGANNREHLMPGGSRVGMAKQHRQNYPNEPSSGSFSPLLARNEWGFLGLSPAACRG